MEGQVVVLHRLNSAATLIQRTTTEAPRSHRYYIGLDVHKKTISYCVKDLSGGIQQEGKVGSSRRELDCWTKTLPQPWSVGMEATTFSGWIYDHLLPHATQIKVSSPVDAACHCNLALAFFQHPFHGFETYSASSMSTFP
jgi:hypothetical protein